VVRVGRELNVHYVLEGSVRKLSNKIRITAQLIDASTGKHLWAERFDRSEDEIFAVQDKVVTTIVGTLARQLQAAGVEKALRKPPQSLAAYECVLRADALPVGDHLAQAEARHWAEKAVKLDPTYGRAHAQLAISHVWEWLSDYSSPSSVLEKACVLAKKAVALDENDNHALAVLGWVHMYRRSFDLAEFCYRKSIALNPNTLYLMTDLGILYGYLGRPQEGIEYYNQAKLVDPYFEPTWYWRMLGVLNFIAGHYEEAIINFDRSPTVPDWVLGYLAACFALSGQKDRAMQHTAEALRRDPSFSSAKFLTREPFKEASDQQRLLEGLRSAGLP
jgi:adenylate cyclase